MFWNFRLMKREGERSLNFETFRFFNITRLQYKKMSHEETRHEYQNSIFGNFDF